jgi:hypothetical protein
MSDHSGRMGAAVEAHYQFLARLMPAVEKFPQHTKRPGLFHNEHDRACVEAGADTTAAIVLVHLMGGRPRRFVWGAPRDQGFFVRCMSPKMAQS